jgi:uncharacterized membrane protein (DUF2068 family)
MHSVSAVSLTLGAVGVASVAARLLLEVLRPSDECGTGFTSAFEWLIWIALVSSALALVLGVVGLVGRTDRIMWTVLGIGLALVVGVLMFIPGVATIVCGSA